MLTLQPFPPLIPGYPQCYSILWSKFFELGHYTVGDDGRAFTIQAVYHCGEELEFGLHSVREEVGVDKDGVGRGEGGVVLKEEGGRDLRDFADYFVAFGFFFGFDFAFVLILLSGVIVSKLVTGPYDSIFHIRTIESHVGQLFA